MTGHLVECQAVGNVVELVGYGDPQLTGSVLSRSQLHRGR